MTGRTQRNPRFRRRLAVQFGAALPLQQSGFTTNVSLRGLAITTPSAQPIGAKLFFLLKVGDASCRAEGRVAWSRRGSPALGIPTLLGIEVSSADEAWWRFVAQTKAVEDERQAVSGLPGSASASTPPPTPVRQPPAPARPRRSEPIIPPPPVNPNVDASGAVPRLRRFRLALPVRFGRSALLEHAGTTVDVSATGLCLATRSLVGVNAPVFLEVALPDRRVARCEGLVVRARRTEPDAVPNSLAVRITRADETWYQQVLSLSGPR